MCTSETNKPTKFGLDKLNRYKDNKYFLNITYRPIDRKLSQMGIYNTYENCLF